jgi:predicted lipoprotein with Yx(FWY)xxD motif
VRIRIIPTLIAAAACAAGCGSSHSSADEQMPASSGAPTPVATAAKIHGPQLELTDSDYGRILASGHRRALYLFTADHGKRSSCSGDCATAWPPYIVKRKPVAAAGVSAGLIGTTRRGDGRLQATYAGHPVYFYEGDSQPGQVLCQAVNEFGGYWYVLRSNGRPVR